MEPEKDQTAKPYIVYSSSAWHYKVN